MSMLLDLLKSTIESAEVVGIESALASYKVSHAILAALTTHQSNLM